MERMGGVTLITADHGNSDEMYEVNKKTGELKRDARGRLMAKTAHTLNPVPFSIVDPARGGEYALDSSLEAPGLSNVAATALSLLGYQPPEHFDRSLIRFGA